MNALTTFSFESASPVRIISINEEPWFVAKDVAEALDYKWNGSKTVGHVPEQWRGTARIKGVESNSTPQEMLILAEHGLYFFLNRSDKPKAIPFQMKVAEIITTIRKTGRYEAPKPVSPRNYLNNNDMNNIKRLIWACTFHLGYKDAWNQGIWYSLRKVTGVPSPAKFEVEHLPVLAHEFQRILNIIDAYTATKIECETMLIKRILREHGDDIAMRNILDHLIKSANGSVIEQKQNVRKHLSVLFDQECLNLVNRKPNHFEQTDFGEFRLN